MSLLFDVTEAAAIVSRVTGRVCGITFRPTDPRSDEESLCGTFSGRVVVLPLIGAREMNVVLAYDGRGGRAVAAALRSTSPRDPTPETVDECIRELLKMIAAELSLALAINYVPGLPRRTTFAELAGHGQAGLGQGVLLLGEGDVNLRLWILEKPAAGSTRGAEAATKSGVLRSLLRRLGPYS